jgi:GTP 3',8-cyclase
MPGDFDTGELIELPTLTDNHGRWIRKLRVSLTDVCNFRCSYCMPKDVRFEPSHTLLPPEELLAMCEGLVEAGITQIRITGGEPMARREFREITEGLSALPLEKLGLTTNGYWLEEYLDFLEGTTCRHINVSLDSLKPDRFEAITNTPFFDRVLRSIIRTRERGFPVKINAVLMRGVNDDEVEDFLGFSERHGIPVRFLEYMRIGPERHRHGDLFMAADEVIGRLREQHHLEPVHDDPDATAFSFRTPGGGEIGFIASESQPFCESCSRMRLSPRGKLRACLFSEDGLDLRGVPRERYPDVLREVMAMKPYYRLPEIAQPMYQIGG